MFLYQQIRVTRFLDVELSVAILSVTLMWMPMVSPGFPAREPLSCDALKHLPFVIHFV